MQRPRTPNVRHRDFLGAHRYTTRGGTVRSAEGVLRTARASPFGRVHNATTEREGSVWQLKV